LTTYRNLNARWLLTGEGEIWANNNIAMVSEPSNDYKAQITLKEVTVYVEKECQLTGGVCAFELLPELKAENEALKRQIEELKNK
jgi:hypothetical protein